MLALTTKLLTKKNDFYQVNRVEDSVFSTNSPRNSTWLSRSLVARNCSYNSQTLPKNKTPNPLNRQLLNLY